MPLVVLPLAHGFQAIDFKARFRFRNAAMAVGDEGVCLGWDEGEAHGHRGVI